MPPPGVGGSPLQLSGSMLQENFEYLMMPIGIMGDLLYHNGTEWVRLPPPSGSGVFVLSPDGNLPSWIETESCIY
jgi:hypothetical protein